MRVLKHYFNIIHILSQIHFIYQIDMNLAIQITKMNYNILFRKYNIKSKRSIAGLMWIGIQSALSYPSSFWPNSILAYFNKIYLSQCRSQANIIRGGISKLIESNSPESLKLALLTYLSRIGNHNLYTASLLSTEEERYRQKTKNCSSFCLFEAEDEDI